MKYWEGIPYATLISRIVLKFLSGQRKETF